MSPLKSRTTYKNAATVCRRLEEFYSLLFS